MPFSFDTTLRNNRLDQITSRVGGGALIRFYTGTRPANVATAVTTQTLLGTCTGGTPFAGSASGGTLTANAITQDSAADATGTATWFRIFQSNGTTAVIDGDCGIAGSGAEAILNTISIVTGGPIQVTSLTFTEGNA